MAGASREEEDESKTQKLTTPELIQQMLSVTNSYPLIMYGRLVKAEHQSIKFSSGYVTKFQVKYILRTRRQQSHVAPAM